jgi:hypothetical protein
MCLTIKRRDNGVEKATAPIVCWKVLSIRARGFKSPHRSATYKCGELKTVKNFSQGQLYPARDIHFTDTLPANKSKRVDAGLHAHGKLSRAKSSASCGSRIVVECRIPKGSLFIRGIYGEFVSLKLKVGKAVAGPAWDVKRFNQAKSKT